MLVQHRWCLDRQVAFAIVIYGAADRPEVAHDRMMGGHCNLHMSDLWILQCLLRYIDSCVGHVMLLQQLAPLRAWFLTENSGQLLVDFLVAGQTGTAISKPRILEEVRAIDDRSQALPEFLWRGHMKG